MGGLSYRRPQALVPAEDLSAETMRGTRTRSFGMTHSV